MKENSSKNVPLLIRIESFRQWKNWIIIPLLIIGVLGLALPLIPGLLIIFFGLTLIKPELADKVRFNIERFVKSFRLRDL